MIRDKEAALELSRTNFTTFSWNSLVYAALAITVLMIALELLQ